MKQPTSQSHDSGLNRGRLVFFGTEQWAAPVLELLAKTYPVVAVVTRPDSRAGRHRRLLESPIKQTSRALQLPVLQPIKLLNAKAELTKLKPSIGVVVAYGRIIPPEIIRLFPHGILNLHPSLLPKYRGPAPVENIILNHDQPGLSIIQLDAGLDSGDIIDSKPLRVVDLQSYTSPQLYQLSGLEGAPFMINCIQKVFNHTAVYKSQDHSQATVTKLVQKSDGIINWSNPATTIERQIRAYLDWPGSRTTIAGVNVTITKAHIPSNTSFSLPSSDTAIKPGQPFNTETGDLAIECGQGVLVIDMLKPDGKVEMSGQAFLAGHKL